MNQAAHSPISLLIVISVAFLVPILLHRLRWNMVPFVVAEIIAGMIIGKSGFNMVHEDSWLSILSLFGLIFLMFLSGLEIDFDAFSLKKKTKVNPFVVASLAFILIFAASFFVSLGLKTTGAITQTFFMTLIISTISLGVVVPVLKERGITETPLGQTILLIAVISDFVTMILLAVFVSLQSHDSTKPLLLLSLFAVTFALYRVIKAFRRAPFMEQLSAGTVQLGTRGVFLLIIFFVALSENMGAENIIGAFLAGVIVSILAPRKAFVHQLDAFGYGFLIPIFFVMVGVKLDLWMLLKNPNIYFFIPLLLLALYVSKVIPLLILRRWFSWRETIGSGMLLTSTLSLVIAAAALALEKKMIDQSLHDGLILVAILSCFISPVFFNKLVPVRKDEAVTSVGIFGANPITMPVALQLEKAGFPVTVYAEEKEVEDESALEHDILVFASEDDDWNIAHGKRAHDCTGSKTIVRTEKLERHQEIKNNRCIPFSTLFSASTLLKTLIESPGTIEFISTAEHALYSLVMGNRRYNGLLLRDLPFLRNVLILRIYRNEGIIIPHGDTELQTGDRLIVTGSRSSIRSLRREFE
ncbi:cation:proton antiporter domain-containing protein [Aneurinibacillus tyrosinisolvens]|uniref:cation:proton antiporter domain-containing protein n=1 Tax=Aneurinibacillus tyrosinisolvens TaxID=1443435 RepID=UPI00063F9086|nr:cation:proton antiporter [Aneurinibacillus tyrosinisolvens]